MSRFFCLKLSLLGATLGLNACSALYSPEQQNTIVEVNDSPTQSNDQAIIYSINSQKQICNESISQDTIHFPQSMLWLGFSGSLNVKDAPLGYSTQGVAQHDRLTISNAQNQVKWFLLKDSVVGAECEFQDPEWSAHPQFLATLAANGDCGNNPAYGLMSVETSSKSVFWFNDHKLNGLATPHLWISQSEDLQKLNLDTKWNATSFDSLGFATLAQVKSYFGHQNVKIIWADKKSSLALKFLDYSQKQPTIQSLPKPAGKEDWNAESALISPDGQWVVYNIFQTPDYYESYLQKLSPNSTPHLIDVNAAAPHWWVNPQNASDVHVVYVKFPASHSYIVKEDLQDPAVWKQSSAGVTLMKSVTLSSSLPEALAVVWGSQTITLAQIPLKGGLSPDGHWLATGTNDAWMVELK